MTGRLYGVGVGPGDPELVTMKALRIVQASPVIAYHAARHGRSNARAVVAAHLTDAQIEVPLIYPITTETLATVEPEGGYEAAMVAFYDRSADALAAHLDAGRDVAVLCEGDPFFYGSYMYLHDRLAHRYETDVIPGVPSVLAGAARLGTPLVRRDTELTVLPGTLPESVLAARLADGNAYAIMKLGRTFGKVRRALERANVLGRASYIERATMDRERIMPVADVDPETVPYFSLVLVPGAGVAPAPALHAGRGRVDVVGLGPGDPQWLSPEARVALDDATDLVGYGPYVDRVPSRPGLRRHASDNRVEVDRAKHALMLAEEGARVCVVSSGDPGIFAMASAVMEAIDGGPDAWRALDVRIVPGISAMQAVAARVGAPLGHDFCAISLSDRLKPWETVASRLDAAAGADFVIALYNPISSQRQWQLAEACAIVGRHRGAQTPVVLARDVGGPTEKIALVELGRLNPRDVDMRTLVLIGASSTRLIARPDGTSYVYTPRYYGSETATVNTAYVEQAPLPTHRP
jgi:precorrin-2 C20-methyltransferase/precorrin-3B C17-methyltransferase